MPLHLRPAESGMTPADAIERFMQSWVDTSVRMTEMVMDSLSQGDAHVARMFGPWFRIWLTPYTIGSWPKTSI